MHKIFLLVCLYYSTGIFAQHSYGTYYVAAKDGLIMREKTDPNSKQLDKVPYGTRVTTLDEPGAWEPINTEGLTGYWKKIKFNNKYGYIIDSYLFPWPPPKTTSAGQLKQYLAQAGIPFGQKLIVKNGVPGGESSWELHKQLYKNGAEYHSFHGYEYGSDTYYLPDFSMQQGFLLLRLIPEFKDIISQEDEFPTSSKKVRKGEREYDIRLTSNGEDTEYTGPFTIDKLSISYEDGASYFLEMYIRENQLVIHFSSGI